MQSLWNVIAAAVIGIFTWMLGVAANNSFGWVALGLMVLAEVVLIMAQRSGAEEPSRTYVLILVLILAPTFFMVPRID